MPKLRCINLDWLEVCVLEPTNSRDGMTNDYARNAAYFEKQGYTVDIRAYGTPMYKEMFTVCNGSKPLIEVRRNPYSAKSAGGIFPDNLCHLRLPNPRLYEGHPVEFLSSFIKCHRYEYKSTTRIDICNDFNTFDNNRDVVKFIRAYMREQYFKMNQKFVHVHGVDSWPFRDYWSLKWGDETSAVTEVVREVERIVRPRSKKAIHHRCMARCRSMHRVASLSCRILHKRVTPKKHGAAKDGTTPRPQLLRIPQPRHPFVYLHGTCRQVFRFPRGHQQPKRESATPRPLPPCQSLLRNKR